MTRKALVDSGVLSGIVENMSQDDAKTTGKSWEDHWATADTPWDAGGPCPSLVTLLDGKKVPSGARALVPGCGSGHDVFALATVGYQTIGLDIAESARPTFEKLRGRTGQTESSATLHTGDFFELNEEELGGKFDFIWDYTFYCAIEPQQRDLWKAQMLRFLAPGGTLAILLFPVVPGAPTDSGPPYPLDPEKVQARLAPDLIPRSIETATASHPGREGKEWLSRWKFSSD